LPGNKNITKIANNNIIRFIITKNGGASNFIPLRG